MKRILLPTFYISLLFLASCSENLEEQEKSIPQPITKEVPEVTGVEFPTIHIDTIPDDRPDYYLKKGLPPIKKPSRMKRILLNRAGAFEKELAYFNGPCLSQLTDDWDSLVKFSQPLARRPFKPHGTVSNKRLFEEFSVEEKIGFFIGNPEEEYQSCTVSVPPAGAHEGISPWFTTPTRGMRYSFRQYLAIKRDSVAAAQALMNYLDSATAVSPNLLRLIERLGFYSTYPRLAQIYKKQSEPDDLILSAMMDNFNCFCDRVEDCCLAKGLEKKLTRDKHGYIENTPKNVEEILKFVLKEAKKRSNGKGK